MKVGTKEVTPEIRAIVMPVANKVMQVLEENTRGTEQQKINVSLNALMVCMGALADQILPNLEAKKQFCIEMAKTLMEHFRLAEEHQDLP